MRIIALLITLGVKGNDWVEEGLLRRGYDYIGSETAENKDAAISKLIKMQYP